MDLANKFNSYDQKKIEAKIQTLFQRKKEATGGARKEDPNRKLAKMKAQALKSIAQTNWMFSSGLDPREFVTKKPEFKNDCLKFL